MGIRMQSKLHRNISLIFRNTILIVLACCLLSACSGHEKRRREVQKFVDEVKQKPAKPIEKIPEFKNYKSFDYSASTLQNPFQPPKVKVVDSGLRPDMDRPKDELEAFPLDGLRMVGTLTKDGKTWALVSAPDKTIYRITAGGYMGKNFGEVKKITKDSIDIKETVPDGLGGWKERDVKLDLSE